MPVKGAEQGSTVDFTKVKFSNPKPYEYKNFTEPLVWVEIDITDEGSGVDTDSLQYRITEPSGELSHWDTVVFWEGENNNSIHISKQLRLVEKLLTKVQFRADDLAGNGYVESGFFELFYDPSLSIPFLELEDPDMGDIQNTPIDLEWEVRYYDPYVLDFSVEIEAPDGNVETIDIEEMGLLSFEPQIPGEYQWKVLCEDENGSAESTKGSFNFTPPFYDVDMPDEIEIDQHQVGVFTFKIKNNLEVPVAIEIEILSHWSIETSINGSVEIEPGQVRLIDFTILENGTLDGSHSINITISDEFGRSRLFLIPLEIGVGKSNGQGSNEEETSINGLLIPGSILIFVLLLFVIIALVLYYTLIKKGQNDQVINIKEEEDEITPYDFSQSDVPLMPGTLGGSNSSRPVSGGSNTMETRLDR